MRRDRDLLALEVKTNSRFRGQLARGLRAVADLPRVVRRVLVYGGRRVLRTEDGIDVWPVERLTEALAAEELWP